MTTFAQILQRPHTADLPQHGEWAVLMETFATEARHAVVDPDSARAFAGAVLAYAERLPAYERADLVSALMNYDGRHPQELADLVLVAHRTAYDRVVAPTLQVVQRARDYLAQSSGIGHRGMLGGGVVRAARSLGWRAPAAFETPDETSDPLPNRGSAR